MTRLDVYTSAPRLRAAGAYDALAEVETLGFDGVWIANVQDDLAVLDRALEATSRLTIGPSVLSIWSVPATRLASWWAGRDRVRLGLGVGHGPLVKEYHSPMASMGAYLDELDAAAVPEEARMIGANGPKMLALSAARSRGALTYLVTPEHTARQRADLGPDVELVPEVKIVLTDDRASARAVARAHLAIYLTLPNYLGNLRRMGYTEDDLTAPGSDRLVDAIVVHGGVEAVQKRVHEHVAAGADGVALHIIGADGLPLRQWRLLAAGLSTAGETR